jgi:uncharacterized OsmC-like protein/pimeloyl-ACP methyl ester carboxylesterase
MNDKVLWKRLFQPYTEWQRYLECSIMAVVPPLQTTFKGSAGVDLAARLDLPVGPVRAFALFAHCFSCTKDVLAAKRIAAGLASVGVAVLRFDFTGLGSSEGEFANTNFSSNVEDLIRAADHLRVNFSAPAILIGHSFGGAAVLAAAASVPEARAVVTIGAPADVAHVLHQFSGLLDDIRRNGSAPVLLAGRKFNIRRSFVEDAQEQRLLERVDKLGRALLIMHAPLDATVGIDNAAKIFAAAKHPKSFVSLDGADHLLSGAEAAGYAAQVIAAWSAKYVAEQQPDGEQSGHVLVRETGHGKYQNMVVVGRHRLVVDEPVSVGGLDSGPNPYDFLAIALGGCTAMTLRLYAEHKKMDLGRIRVMVRHGKAPTEHHRDCDTAADQQPGKVDRFERTIAIEGPIDEAQRLKLAEIAGKCPVHRTLEQKAIIVTNIEKSG